MLHGTTVEIIVGITCFLGARPFSSLLHNTTGTIAEITVLVRQIGRFCLDGTETGAEKVKKIGEGRREREGGGRRNTEKF